MRSSKPRSRKSNRNRPQQSGGNIPNRVFDSSGPEGKVRGTPQQIIDKYQQLARDSQLSGDRVATENFSQHAEHYLRLLGAAQKEIDERREQQERENRERQAERDRERAERDAQREAREAQQGDVQQQATENAPNNGAGDQPDVIDANADTGLVETPESKPSKPRPQRKPRAPRKPAAEKAASDAPIDPQPAPDAAE
ncbi:MAG: DUF4167 domain-containing protein [Planktotalea sp.]|uniref:DUF4167 domain-containing protein n=1 Tax=Planktotalea sp. TaxID=2029877 RepID=UPI003C770DC0